MFRIASLFLAYLAVPAFAALGTQTSRQLQTTIVDLAAATPSLSTFLTAVNTAELQFFLGDPDRTLTVFAPTNDAFGALPAGLLTTLLSTGFEVHLRQILLYHVFANAALLSTALAATRVFNMLNGEMVTVTKTGTELTVTTTGGTTVTGTILDVEESNGVVHVIDGVLMPSSIGATVIDIGAGYSTLLSLITLAGLDETLSGGPFTLFAPTNAAFAALSAGTVDFLTSDDGAALLTSILTYHVVFGSVPAEMVTDGDMYTTVQGEMITFTGTDTVMVNDATVVDPDLLAFNGVTHGIDKMLMIPGPPTIADLAMATPSLSTLVTAVTTAELWFFFSRPDVTLTLFAPTNDAFRALPAGLHASLLTPGFKIHLQEILLYHVFSGVAILTSDIAATEEIKMLNGEMVTVAKTDTGVTVTTNGGTTVMVTIADVEESNGVVHVIDGVLLPSSIGASVIDIGSKYSTLLSLITTAGLPLTGFGHYTLFAPTNTAFEALSADTVALLASDDGTAMLASILTYHLVIASMTSDMLTDGAMIVTGQGQMITFAVGDTVMVNDATVVEADMLAFNGVTHGIDRVLMPSDDSMADDSMTSGGLALGASFSALFAAGLAVAL